MHAMYQTVRPDRLTLTHTELSDGLNCTEGHIGLAPRWATQIAELAAQAVCVTSKRIIHLHVWPLKVTANRSALKNNGALCNQLLLR